MRAKQQRAKLGWRGRCTIGRTNRQAIPRAIRPCPLPRQNIGHARTFLVDGTRSATAAPPPWSRVRRVRTAGAGRDEGTCRDQCLRSREPNSVKLSRVRTCDPSVTSPSFARERVMRVGDWAFAGIGGAGWLSIGGCPSRPPPSAPSLYVTTTHDNDHQGAEKAKIYQNISPIQMSQQSHTSTPRRRPL